MNKEQLQKILDEHARWLKGEGGQKANLKGANLEGAKLKGADLEGAYLEGANIKGAYLEGADLKGANLERANLERANLEEANLEGANLKGANLGGANLKGADLKGANLDYSVINLSCKDLGIHIDDRLAIQRLYHTLYNVAYSKHVSQELKDKLLTGELLEIANRFHRVEECGKIKRLVQK